MVSTSRFMLLLFVVEHAFLRSNAAPITVVEDQDQFREAVADGASIGVITDITLKSEIIIPDSVITLDIKGYGNTISGGRSTLCFEVDLASTSVITWTKLVFSNCYADAGGAFKTSGGTMIFKKCIFAADNYVVSSIGGALLINSGAIYLINSRVLNDIYMVSGKVGVFSNCMSGTYNPGGADNFTCGKTSCGTLPRDMTTGSCLACEASSPFSCCGARACSASAPFCSSIQDSICPNPSPPPTARPSLTPTLSILPSVVPSPNPTYVPSYWPSSSPTLAPTLNPTDFPSYRPSSSPTMAPTLNPTDVPSYRPSLVPTAHPTVDPTPAPSMLPSASPTLACAPGTYLSTASCVACPAGKFSNATFPPWPSSCTECEAGTYALQGSVSCPACATGKLSSEDRSFCRDCNAGEYSKDNLECAFCESGRYAPTAQTGSCLYCFGGFRTNLEIAATTCTPCDGGSFSSGGATECTLCALGSFSPSGQTTCKGCEKGRYADAEGQASCTRCPAGFASEKTGAAVCDACASGRFQSRTGEPLCDACASGRFASASGSLACANCPEQYASLPAAGTCSLAAAGNYLRAGVSHACPKHAACFGGDSLPLPDKSFWVDRRSVSYARFVYACERSTCVGGGTVSSLSEAAACWSPPTFVAREGERKHEEGSLSPGSCDSDTLLCKEGAAGFLCGSCEDGWTFNSALSVCVLCASSSNTTPIAFFCVLMVVGAVAAILYIRGLRMPESWLDAIPLLNILKHVDKGMLKVCWSTFQIISTISWSLSVTFPPPFSQLLFVLDFLKFDFLSLDCVTGENSFYTKMVVISLVPIMLALLNGFAFALRRLHASFESAKDRARVTSQHATAFLVLTYVVLPPCAMVQFRSLDCDTLPHSSESFLRADSNIDCNSDQYKAFQGVSILFILVYQSLPLFWLVLLWRVSDRLNPSSSSAATASEGGFASSTERLNSILETRTEDVELSYLSFLWSDYGPSMWYYEVCDMYRRIIFIAVIPLLFTGSMRASLGCFLSIMVPAFVREASPFLRHSTNVLALVATYQILGTFLAALVIVSGSLAEFHLSDFALGCILLGFNFVLLPLIATWCLLAFLKEREEKQWKRELTTQELKVVDIVMGRRQTSASINSGSDPDGMGVELTTAIRHNLKRVSDNFEMGPPTSQDKKKYEARAQEVLSQKLLKATDVHLIKRIGAGAFGEVFKATVHGQNVAVKTILTITEANVRAFRSEILLTSSLRHPNVVNFVGACFGKELMCLVLEWVSRGSLGDLLEDKALDLSWDAPLLNLAMDVARGMAYLHGRKFYDEVDGVSKECIIHRDLKPENCLVSEFTTAKLGDFGTSRARGVDDVTMTAVGTPLYCAPEIPRGEAYDESVDVYSFGMTLLDMATDSHIVDFICERWLKANGKTKAPKRMNRIVRPMVEDGWRPVTLEDPIPFSPASINRLLVSCCCHDPRGRPSFATILEDLEGRCKAEVEGVAVFRRRANDVEGGISSNGANSSRDGSNDDVDRESKSDEEKEPGVDFSQRMHQSTANRLSRALSPSLASSSPLSTQSSRVSVTMRENPLLTVATSQTTRDPLLGDPPLETEAATFELTSGRDVEVGCAAAFPAPTAPLQLQGGEVQTEAPTDAPANVKDSASAAKGTHGSAKQTAGGASAAAGSCWSTYVDEFSGNKYYVNSATGETSWTRNSENNSPGEELQEHGITI